MPTERLAGHRSSAAAPDCGESAQRTRAVQRSTRSDPTSDDSSTASIELADVSAATVRESRPTLTATSTRWSPCTARRFPDFNLVLSRIADRHAVRGRRPVRRRGDRASAAVQRDEPARDDDRAHAPTSTSSCGCRSPVAVSIASTASPAPTSAFWPMGRIGHTAGIIFIRRGFRDPVYSFVLRQYVGWLTEHRANFLWAHRGRPHPDRQAPAAEGGPARVRGRGAYVDGRAPDVTLVPATVVYEYLERGVRVRPLRPRRIEVAARACSASLSFARQQRRVPPEARIHVGIGEPVSLGDFVERGGDPPSSLPSRHHARRDRGLPPHRRGNAHHAGGARAPRRCWSATASR